MVKKVIEQVIVRVRIPAMEALENLGAQTQEPQEAGAIQVIKMIHGEEQQKSPQAAGEQATQIHGEKEFLILGVNHWQVIKRMIHGVHHQRMILGEIPITIPAHGMNLLEMTINQLK